MLIDDIKQIAERITPEMLNNITTEEATKNAIIMPVIAKLGYDVFNPMEVVPEMDCDVGLKKFEKIDYAIKINGEVKIIVECKHHKENLDKHYAQLFRYYGVSNARFAILTNGLEWRFYCDIDEQNKMDKEPFLTFKLSDIDDKTCAELAKFKKDSFNADELLDEAEKAKYRILLRQKIDEEFSAPSDEFVRFFVKKVYQPMLTPKKMTLFKTLMVQAIGKFTTDQISEKLGFVVPSAPIAAPSPAPVAAPAEETQADASAEAPAEEAQKPKITTTQEELTAFEIIKAILVKKVDINRVKYRDTLSYFGILLDDNNRKPICRLFLESATSKKIVFVHTDRTETTYKLDSVTDIGKYSKDLKAIIDEIENKPAAPAAEPAPVAG